MNDEKDEEKFKLLIIKLEALRAFVLNVSSMGRSLFDYETGVKFRNMYEDIKETLDDPNLEIYAPNISIWGRGGNGLLKRNHQVEIVNNGVILVKYLEQLLVSNSPKKNLVRSNIFISHGKPSEALDLLIEFIEAIGLNPIVVMNQPNQGMSIDNKVKTQIEMCVAVIVLATGDDEVNGILQPRQNVIHEIGYAEKGLNNKIIYLLEERTNFPSNIPQAYTRFTKDNLTKAFIAIVRDLKSFGIL